MLLDELIEDKKKTLIFAATNIHADMIVNILHDDFEALLDDIPARKKILFILILFVKWFRQYDGFHYPC